MTRFPQSPSDRIQVESLVQNGKYREALAVLDRRLKENPLDLECRLLRLLLSMKFRGPERFEGVITAVRSLPDLGERESEIVREILLLGFEAAQKSGQTEKMRAYERELALRAALTPATSGIAAHPARTPPKQKLAAASFSVLTLFNAASGAKPDRGLPGSAPEKAAPRNLAVIISAVMLVVTPLTYYVFGNGKVPARQTGGAPSGRAAAETAILIGEEPPRGTKNNSTDAAIQSDTEPASRSAAAVTPSNKEAGRKDTPNKPVREVRRAIPIREKPRFASAVLQEVNRGAKIVVLEVEGSWLKVQTQEHGTIGFVRKEFTSPPDAR